MKNEKFLITLTISFTILLLAAGAFYWYEWRPTQLSETTNKAEFDNLKEKLLETETDLKNKTDLLNKASDNCYNMIGQNMRDIMVCVYQTEKDELDNLISGMSADNAREIKLDTLEKCPAKVTYKKF
ncbi:hypothetical protein KKG82_03710 [Patescibacteria group bacterium]|nr:hypothetical protein [Patescibacteria group bacterium]